MWNPADRAAAGTCLLHADQAAGDPLAGVSGRLASQVIRVGVDDQRLAGNRVGRQHADAETRGVQRCAQRGVAVGVGSDVAEVAAMMPGAARRAMRFAARVVVPSCAHCVGRAAVAFFMDMNAMLARREALETSVHHHLAGALDKGRGATGGVALGRVELGNGDRHRRQDSAARQGG